MGCSPCLEGFPPLCVGGQEQQAHMQCNEPSKQPGLGQEQFTVPWRHRAGSVSGQEGLPPVGERAGFGARLGKITPVPKNVLQE